MTATVDGTAGSGAWTAPLTEAQIGLLLVQRSVTARHLYNVPVEIELDPAVTDPCLRAALSDVVAVQPALRTALRPAPQPHAGLLAPPSPENLPLTEAVAGDDFDRHKDEVVQALAATEFDLAEPPLFRAVHLRSAAGDRRVLVLVVHHTVFDGFSLQPLVKDLNAALRGDLDVARLRPARERALHRELSAQCEAAADPAAAEAAADMGARLRATPATVVYPRPNRPAETDFTGRRRHRLLDPAASAAVDRACERLATTPFVFFSAVYGAVLARHTGNSAVTFGSPLLSRRTIGSYSLCGFFVNTLPLVLDVDWDTGFDRYVAEVVEPRVRELKQRAAVPFSQVVRHADPDRSTSRNPLFSVMLAMQDSTEVAGPGAVRSLREHGNGAAKFDLWLGVTPTAAGWLLELEYDVALVPEPVAEGVLDSLWEALGRAAGDETRTLSELFSDAAAQPWRADDGHWHEPAAADLDGWFRATARRVPDNTAVTEPGRSLSYRELDAAAGRLASGLRGRGIAPGQVVGLTTSTLADTVTTILAVLRVGAAFLPLDLTLPAERLAYMVEKADCRLVIGEGEVPGRTVVPPAEAAVPAGAADGAAAAAADAGRPAGGQGGYVMFTSGSTGRPKGVVMGNGPLLNLTAWQLDALAMDASTRFLQYAPLGFDVSFQEILPTLMAGGTVVSREPADRRDLPAVVRRVTESEASHVYLPVAALRPFVQAAVAADAAFEHVTHVCVSGEQLVVDGEVEDFFARRPWIELVNLYGPTETHAVSTHRLSAAAPGWPPHVPVGRPIRNVTAQVVDSTGHLAPIGVAGELLAGGACPAVGYINDPEQTARRFVGDPYGPPGARRYRTGDQVMWNHESVLVFLGRDDHQVKIRGFRVELGEVESAALAHPEVREAVAAVRGEGADRHLLLFLRPAERPGGPAAPAPGGLPDDVARQLAARLPGYMVPRRVLVVDAMPTTGNGKFDRPALLALADRLIEHERDRHEERVPLPDDALEAWLLDLWSELLDRRDLPAAGSLLEYGAHSLNVLTALARIEEEYGVRVPVLDFFRAPTVRELAGLVRAGSARPVLEGR